MNMTSVCSSCGHVIEVKGNLYDGYFAYCKYENKNTLYFGALYDKPVYLPMEGEFVCPTCNKHRPVYLGEDDDDVWRPHSFCCGKVYDI